MPFNWEFIPGRKGLNIGTISGGKWFSLSSTLSNSVPLTLRTRHKVELMEFFDWFLLKPYKTIHGLPIHVLHLVWVYIKWLNLLLIWLFYWPISVNGAPIDPIIKRQNQHVFLSALVIQFKKIGWLKIEREKVPFYIIIL